MLPGGEDAPDDAEGWCLNINPGTASVVRMQEGLDPLVLYLPDMIVDIGVIRVLGKIGWLCHYWRSGITVEDGAEIGIALDVGEGAVLYYGQRV